MRDTPMRATVDPMAQPVLAPSSPQPCTHSHTASTTRTFKQALADEGKPGGTEPTFLGLVALVSADVCVFSRRHENST